MAAGHKITRISGIWGYWFSCSRK